MRRGPLALAGVLLLGVSACGGETSEPGGAASSVTPSPVSSASEKAEYTNLPEVVVDDNGMRSFPDQTHQEYLNIKWSNLLQSLAPDEAAALTRPDVQLVQTFDDFAQYAQAYVPCMHDAGWNEVTFNTTDQTIDAEVPPEQMSAYQLSDYVCSGQYYYHVPPMNEEQIGMLWDYNNDVVLPCLAKYGYTDVPFDSREAFIDRYFAQRTYTLPITALGLDQAGERHPCDTLPSFLDK